MRKEYVGRERFKRVKDSENQKTPSILPNGCECGNFMHWEKMAGIRKRGQMSQRD